MVEVVKRIRLRGPDPDSGRRRASPASQRGVTPVTASLAGKLGKNVEGEPQAGGLGGRFVKFQRACVRLKSRW
jgi:hypothetical protein